MRFLCLLCFYILLLATVNAQVGIGTEQPNLHAVLDLKSPSNDQGFLAPRLTTAQRTSSSFEGVLTAAENGMLVFDSDERTFYYWIFPAWRAIEAGLTATVWRSGTGIPSDGIGEDNDFYLDLATSDVYQKISGIYTLFSNIKGEKGDQGDPGPAGPSGPQGGPGPPGPAGPQGLQGETGIAGPPGPQGLKGDIGLTGPQGTVGPTGPQGLKGDKGDPGPTGPQGLKGETGPTGPQGPAGPAGLQGLKGDVGLTGPQGPVGPQGPKGDPGIQGIQGLKGDKGDTGTTGATGLQGPAGPQGPQGPTGPQGPQGIPGRSTLNLREIVVLSDKADPSTDDILIGVAQVASVQLPSAKSAPGKVFYFRLNRVDNKGLIINASSFEGIIDRDGTSAASFQLSPTIMGVTIVSNGQDGWYVIATF